MPKIGLRDLHVHEIENETDTSVEYGEAVKIAKLIEVSISPQVSEASLYGDDQLTDFASALSRYDITINVGDLTPEQVGMLLGQEVNEAGMVYSSIDLNQPEFGVSFRAQNADGTFQYRQMFKVKFSPSDETYNTKGENIEFQTESITGVAMPLKMNGNFDTKVIGTDANKEITDKWFEEIFYDADAVGSEAGN